MIKNIFFTFFLAIITLSGQAQAFMRPTKAATRWVENTFRQLNDTQKIAQLMVVRAHSNLGHAHEQSVTALIQQYNIGALCFFQGGPIRQALLTNYYQSIAKTPLMICIDAEWGLGMRLDSVSNFPKQLLVGATNSSRLAYQLGNAVGQQCKRMGIHVNYAPVVDVNNNRNNPVINDRSFGENKIKVAQLGIAYMRGLQKAGIMACAKHFPGHGDVAVDSHYDLPIINKTSAQLDSLELYPFKKMIAAGVGSMMTAHLYIPALDTTANRASSLSPKITTQLLQEQLHFKGLVVTDGLEMKGVTNYFPNGEAAVQALIAGNDMLCVPMDVPLAITKTLEAINAGKISWNTIDQKVKKVLLAKYHLQHQVPPHVDTTHLLTQLNAATESLNNKMASRALTLIQLQTPTIHPITAQKRIAYVSIGADGITWLGNRLQQNHQAHLFAFANKNTLGKQLMDDTYTTFNTDKNDTLAARQLLHTLQDQSYDCIVVGLHNYSRRPANNFGLSSGSVWLLQQLSTKQNVITCYFGNPYAIQNTCEATNLVACYEDNKSTQLAFYNWLQGTSKTKGKLPVSVCPKWPYGTGTTP